jgi:hypothetical protein
VVKRARAFIVERASAVQAAEEATSDLVTRFQQLQTRYDSAKIKIKALIDEIAKLKQNKLSRLSMQSARTERDQVASAVFDPQDQTPFDMGTTAGRQLFSTALKSLRACLLRHCVPERGSAARLSAAASGATLTASVLKRRILMCYILEEIKLEIDGNDEAGK